jgi:hypothetical protein
MSKGEIRSLAFAVLVLPWGSTAHAHGTFTIDVPGARGESTDFSRIATGRS